MDLDFSDILVYFFGSAKGKNCLLVILVYGKEFVDDKMVGKDMEKKCHNTNDGEKRWMQVSVEANDTHKKKQPERKKNNIPWRSEFIPLPIQTK